VHFNLATAFNDQGNHRMATTHFAAYHGNMEIIRLLIEDMRADHTIKRLWRQLDAHFRLERPARLSLVLRQGKEHVPRRGVKQGVDASALGLLLKV
jgi:hypothetical protein